MTYCFFCSPFSSPATVKKTVLVIFRLCACTQEPSAAPAYSARLDLRCPATLQSKSTAGAVPSAGTVRATQVGTQLSNELAQVGTQLSNELVQVGTQLSNELVQVGTQLSNELAQVGTQYSVLMNKLTQVSTQYSEIS